MKKVQWWARVLIYVPESGTLTSYCSSPTASCAGTGLGMSECSVLPSQYPWGVREGDFLVLKEKHALPYFPVSHGEMSKQMPSASFPPLLSLPLERDDSSEWWVLKDTLAGLGLPLLGFPEPAWPCDSRILVSSPWCDKLSRQISAWGKVRRRGVVSSLFSHTSKARAASQ